jgi:hypothetical protein
LTFAACAVNAAASVPTVAQLDAASRAAGNRKDIAIALGNVLFATKWPAQVSQVSANEFDSHLIVGIRVWGVKFHQPMTRGQFVTQVAQLIEQTFKAEPRTEEVDLWASVPLNVGKGVIVSGDLAKPTTRTVFSVTVRRGEASAALGSRVKAKAGVFWDEDWARAAFKQGNSV